MPHGRCMELNRRGQNLMTEQLNKPHCRAQHNHSSSNYNAIRLLRQIFKRWDFSVGTENTTSSEVQFIIISTLLTEFFTQVVQFHSMLLTSFHWFFILHTKETLASETHTVHRLFPSCLHPGTSIENRSACDSIWLKYNHALLTAGHIITLNRQLV